MSVSVTQGNVRYDSKTEELVVRSRSGNRIKGQFSAIGPITNRKRRGRIVKEDVFDLLDRVSKGAFSVFNNLKFNRSEENNITKYVPDSEFSKTDKESLSRRIKELKDVGLIVNVRKSMSGGDKYKTYAFTEPRSTFIINPEMIRCTSHDEAEYLFGQCAGGVK